MADFRRVGLGRRLRLAALVSALCSAAIPSSAPAQDAVFDHLACHAIKDSLPRGSVRADLFPAQPDLFPAGAGCRVKLPAKLFCEDVQKRNVQPPAPLVVDGDQTRKFFCYAVVCPRSADGQSFAAEDQFGARSVSAKRPRFLCAPANMLAPTPTPTPPPTSGECADAAYPACGGSCLPGAFGPRACLPLGGDCTCIQVTPVPTTTPTPTPSVRPCGRDGNGVCGGDCGPFSICFDFGFFCGCEPPTPFPPTPTPTP